MFALDLRMQRELAWTKVTRRTAGATDFILRANPSPLNLDDKPDADNPFIPSGYTYLLQLVAHDMVLHPRTVLGG